MSVIFSDLEPIIVEHIQNSLDSYGGTVASNVRVATRKAPPQATQPSKEVIIAVSYGVTTNKVIREASAVIDIYADDYATASDLASLVAALIIDVESDPIKMAEVNVGPIRVPNQGPQEQRSMTVDFVVKGSTL